MTVTIDPLRAAEVRAVMLLADTLADRLDNAWPAHLRDCLEAAYEGRPAYWTVTDGTEVIVSNVAVFATRQNDLEKALEFYTRETAEKLRIMDNLIPLNHEAILQLRNSYAGRTKVWPRLGTLYDRRFFTKENAA